MSGERSSDTAAELWASASHELRQPVQALLLLTHTLKRQKREKDRKASIQALESGLVAVYEMLEILNRMASIETGRHRREVQAIELDRMYEALSDDFFRLAAERGVNLRCRPWRGRVYGDNDVVPIILKSLISSSIDEAGGRDTLCGFRPSSGGQRLEIYHKPNERSTATAERAFHELNYGRDQDSLSHIVLGKRLTNHACEVLGYTLNCEHLKGGWHRLSLTIPHN